MNKQDGVKLHSWRSGITAGAILLAMLVLCGCGSDSKQGSKESADKSKAVIDKERGNLKILEVPQSKEPLTGKAIQEEGKTTKLPETVDMDVEVVPPNRPGEKGMTLREVEALRKQKPQIDPLDQEVIPPSGPGQKGMTLREVEALRKQKPQIDPLDQEVIPPSGPGQKGMTLREVEALRKQQPLIDPLDQEVIPPSEPGQKGMTRREVERLRTLQPKSLKSN